MRQNPEKSRSEQVPTNAPVTSKTEKKQVEERLAINANVVYETIATATVHPSSILRAPDDASRETQMTEFVRDLKAMQSL